ncbi:MAG: C40 family peptidase [Prolixibacteraceae bacterium]|nr:C40 family peptidase [Prolixibacteraceae bacterium]
MKVLFINKLKITILIIIAGQLINTSCSKRIYQGISYKNIENSAEKRDLKKFINQGTGKRVNNNSTNADEIINTAHKFLGVPHCTGGTTSRCMDCSGFLVTVFGIHNIYLPHNSEEQARYGKIIAKKEKLNTGDLVFFIKSYKTNRFITHSGIYLGNEQFIHVSSSRGVTITSIYDPWWNQKFIFGTRIFK